MKRNTVVITSILAVCCLAFVSVYGQDSTEIKGYITGRTGDGMTVRSTDGTTHSIVLNDDTKVQMPKGLGLRHKTVGWTNLIPGLRVSVKGTTNSQGKLVASEVRFNKDDLQNATMIQAGLAPTQQQVQTQGQTITEQGQAISANQQAITANQQQISQNEQETDKRFAELADYDVKQDVKVYFATGSSVLSAKGKAALSQLATQAVKLPTYLIQVQGYCDSSGSLAMNQTLSRDRAESVIEYLMQQGNISPRHIVAPGAMGISAPAASNETAQGRAENRRVEVKVLVNKGVSAAGR